MNTRSSPDTVVFAVECTEIAPWDRVTRGPVLHRGVREVGDQHDGYPTGDLVIMQCRFCGHSWEKELPQ